MITFLAQLEHALKKRNEDQSHRFLNDAGRRLLDRTITHRLDCCIDAGDGEAAGALVLLYRLKGEKERMA